MNYKEAMDYIDNAQKYGSVLGLETITELLRRLGNPERELKVIHIAGTNGKGSTAAFISSILAEAGCLVGRYLSPVIFSYRERIQIQQKSGSVWIKEEDVARYLSSIKENAEQMAAAGYSHPTPFEMETAMAFLEFKEKQCDFVVLEVGLGGRKDATNVMDQVECAVITSIGMDHMNVLGSTLEEITLEKAGIIKTGCHVVTYDQDFDTEYEEYKKYLGKGDTPARVIQRVCTEKKAILTKASFRKIRNAVHHYKGITFDYKEYTNLKIKLLGECQPKNAVTAIETAHVLMEKGYPISKENIYLGLVNTIWRGRFELLNTEIPVIVDGAHNESASRTLAASIQLYLKERNLIFLIGVLRDKDYHMILKYTAPFAKRIITITPDHERALPSGKLKEAALLYHKEVEDGHTVEEGLSLAVKNSGKQDAILVFGSFSFLDEVYRYFNLSGQAPGSQCSVK